MRKSKTEAAQNHVPIKVIGVGGAGCNMLQHLTDNLDQDVAFIASNTDDQLLKHINVTTTILLSNSGTCAMMQPEIGRQKAEESRKIIEDELHGASVVFILAGLGKGTGTGAAPVVAEIANSAGAFTVVLVSEPFSYEGKRVSEIAQYGIDNLQNKADLLITFPMHLIEKVHESDSMYEWIRCADDLFLHAVSCIIESFNEQWDGSNRPKLIKRILSKGGETLFGTDEASSDRRANIAVQGALFSPWLQGKSLSQASGALINIRANESLREDEIDEVLAKVRLALKPNAEVAFGVTYDKKMGAHLARYGYCYWRWALGENQLFRQFLLGVGKGCPFSLGRLVEGAPTYLQELSLIVTMGNDRFGRSDSEIVAKVKDRFDRSTDGEI